MLPQIHRLPKHRVRAVLTSGTRAYSHELICFSLQGETSNPRFAFVVQKHVQKSAVKRNYIKRLLREICYALMPQINHPLDVVIIAKPQVTLAQKKQIEQSVKAFLQI